MGIASIPCICMRGISGMYGYIQKKNGLLRHNFTTLGWDAGTDKYKKCIYNSIKLIVIKINNN